MSEEQPTGSTPSDASVILARLAHGDERAADELLPLIYGELRAIAQRAMAKERSDHTLQATALVHEAYVRLIGGGHTSFKDRAHFFRSAARAMRSLLVDHARARNAKKRGGVRRRVELDDALVSFDDRAADYLAVDEALKHLAARDPDLAHLVELRFFAGLSNEQTAEVLGVSTRTVERDWRTARAFLRAELADTDEDGDAAQAAGQ